MQAQLYESVWMIPASCSDTDAKAEMAATKRMLEKDGLVPVWETSYIEPMFGHKAGIVIAISRKDVAKAESQVRQQIADRKIGDDSIPENYSEF